MLFPKEKAEASELSMLLSLFLNTFTTTINSLMLMSNPSKEEIKLRPTTASSALLSPDLKAGNSKVFERIDYKIINFIIH